MIQKIIKHIKQGTLGTVIKNVIRHNLGVEPISRLNVGNQKDAISLLISQTNRWLLRTTGNKKVLIVSDHSRVSSKIESGLSQKKIPFQKTTLDMLDQISSNDAYQLACIIAGFLDPKQLTKLGIELAKHPLLSEIPFEFSIVPKYSYATLLRHDWQENTSFISPLLISDIDYFGIYELSLSLFERKCQIRDYMDLCQLLQTTLERQVEGDVAEFGSFQGHSGYLIAQVLHKINNKKKLYMFDTFEEFPKEVVGVDAFWNKTHQVDYKEVKAKFRSFENVTLVKGDFTETFSRTDINKLCFVYIDCDSYRGTKFLLNTIYDSHLSENGIIVLEDYGHGTFGQ